MQDKSMLISNTKRSLLLKRDNNSDNNMQYCKYNTWIKKINTEKGLNEDYK